MLPACTVVGSLCMEKLVPMAAIFAVLGKESETAGAREKIARWFGLTVLIRDKQGLVRPFSALLGKDRLVERFAATVARRIPTHGACRAVVGHCDASEDAARLAAALREALPQLGKVWVVETGPAIGVHAGPGSLVVGVQWQ